jgi:long-chain acyl-CoA synthetase
MEHPSVLERPWHKKWPEGVSRHIEYPDIPVDELLRRSARAHPDWPAVFFFGKRISYRAIDQAVDRFAAALRRIGVKPGDRVGLLLPNTPHFVIAFFGILRAGAIVAQTNPLFTPPELETLWSDAGVETVVALDLFWHNLSKALPKTPVKRVVVCDVAEFLPFPLRQLYPIKRRRDLKKQNHWPLAIPHEPNVWRFAAVLRHGGPPFPPPAIDPANDVAVLQYTGGTTGTPKGAMLTHRNLVSNALMTNAWMNPKPGIQDRFFGVIPLFHVYGVTAVLLTGVTRAAELILYPNPREIDHILKLINRTKPTIFPGVPTMYIAILRNPHLERYDLRSIEACISGAAPLPLEVRRQFEAATGGRLVEGYGLTEASPVTHCNPLNADAKECIGLPFPDTDARIVDPEDWTRTMPDGESGELIIHGPQVMKGYWNKPEESADMLKDGWLLTGDIARMDEDGFFYIVDRKKDMILCSGYNVYPREVEEVLFAHPAIQEAAAIGVPDPYRGETVKAFVVLKAGKTATAVDIIAFCKERLAPFKVPKMIEFTKDLPKSLVGKVLRRELRARELAKSKSSA